MSEAEKAIFCFLAFVMWLPEQIIPEPEPVSVLVVVVGEDDGDDY